MGPPLTPLYRKKGLVIFWKPQGIPSVPGNEPSFCEAVFQTFPELSEIHGRKENEGGLLNRLDNGTAGLLLFAENQESFDYYHQLQESSGIEKSYLAVVRGCPEETNGTIHLPIAHHPRKKNRMVVLHSAYQPGRSRPQESETQYQVMETQNGLSLVRCLITKGRRHQIRVHLASLGTPLVGDPLYGLKEHRQQDLLVPFHSLYAVGLSFRERGGELCTVDFSPFGTLAEWKEYSMSPDRSI